MSQDIKHKPEQDTPEPTSTKPEKEVTPTPGEGVKEEIGGNEHPDSTAMPTTLPEHALPTAHVIHELRELKVLFHGLVLQFKSFHMSPPPPAPSKAVLQLQKGYYLTLTADKTPAGGCTYIIDPYPATGNFGPCCPNTQHLKPGEKRRWGPSPSTFYIIVENRGKAGLSVNL